MRETALQHHQAGRFAEAIEACRHTLAIHPNDAATLQTLGNALLALQRVDEAIEAYRQGLFAQPNSAGLHINLANALRTAGRLEEAVISYRSAILVYPKRAQSYSDLGHVLCLLERHEEAVQPYRQALVLNPDDANTLIGLASVLLVLKEYEDACEHFQRALRLRPDDTSVLYGLGCSLLAQFRHKDAVPYLERAAELRPEHNDTRAALGNALLGANRNAEALLHYRTAEESNKDAAGLQLNQALALLGNGAWSEGWQRFEARFSAVPEALPGLDLPKDAVFWRGEDIAGRTILLQAEQGFGDTILCVRYAPLVAERGAKVVLRVQYQLAKLVAEMRGIDTLLTNIDPTPAIGLVCPLMSLPLAFGTEIATVPGNVPYLKTPSAYRLLWQTLLGVRRRPRIGVAWRGQQHLPHRSMPLAKLAPLLQCASYEFHGLQKEMTEADREWLAANPLLIDHSAELQDFADTAAIAEEMDLVISIDTSVAHLAGALARPLWIMLPFSGDFRWLLDRGDSPWYPTARLFRQERPGDWDQVVADVVRALLSLQAEGEAIP
jgi:tetratricopeptide (TPR) repeat protein